MSCSQKPDPLTIDSLFRPFIVLINIAISSLAIISIFKIIFSP